MSATHRPVRTASHLLCAVLVSLSALLVQLPGSASAATEPSVTVDDSVVPDTLEAQFSDPVTTTFTASSDQGSGALEASATGLPAGITLSAKSVTSPSDASWTISGAPTAVPGDYPVHVTVTDGVAPDFFDFDVEVAEEDAAVVYTGPTSVVGPDYEADEVAVTVSAQVTQAADGNLGAINAATVTFTDTVEDVDFCTGVVATTGTGPGVASCTFNADLSQLDSAQYFVGLTVEGSYAGESAGDTIVTVSLPDEPEAVPPDTKITSGPSGWLLSTTAKFTFVSTAPDSDTDFFCRLDAGKAPCSGSSVTLDGLAQRAHTFSVVAENEDGDADETPATRDFAVPVDDVGLAGSPTWKRVKNGASYLGTFSQAKKKGVALTYQVNKVRELALLVRTGSKFGSVKVYLDGTLLKTVKTAGPAGSRMVQIGQFSAARSGTVKIVTTTSKTVRIDGLGVSTVAF